MAVADFYPDVTLTGSYGNNSLNAGDLFDSASRMFMIGPSISLPIFQGGRLRGQLQLRRSQEREAALSYRKTVLAAWRDVDDALTEIIRTHGGMTNDKARDYKRQLVADKRYVRDVY